MSNPKSENGVDARYQQIVDALPDLVYVVDREHRVVLINQSLLNSLPSLGLEQSPLGRTTRDAFPFVPEQTHEGIEAAFVTGEVQSGVIELAHPTQGHHEVAECIRVPLLDDDGEVRWVASLVRSREREHAIEQRLRAERNQLRAVLDAVPLPVTITDLEARVVDCNDRAWREGGYPSKEAYLDRNGIEFVSEADRARAVEYMVRTYREGVVHDVPYQLLRVDGSRFSAKLSSAVVRGENGEPVGYVAVVRPLDEPSSD